MNAEATRVAAASILLVDDDVELLKALTKVLEKDGFEIVPLPNAQSAIDYIQSTKRRFDLVITDMSMPGMPGSAFLPALKTAFPSVPVIVITAFGDWGEYMNTLREGAFAYLSKPVEKSELLATVHRALVHAGTKSSAR